MWLVCGYVVCMWLSGVCAWLYDTCMNNFKINILPKSTLYIIMCFVLDLIELWSNG